MAQPLKIYHDGSIRDINAVGNRDVGCAHGLDRRYSLEAQIAMGRSHAQEPERASQLVTDPVITQYVTRIGQNLVRSSDAQVRFTFKIIATDDVNAFSLAAGFIFVDSGLILAVDDEAELAAVISHEIAHVAACHGAQEMAREEAAHSVAMPLIFRLAARHINPKTLDLAPARSFESDADFLAIQYLYKAGYDPQALSAFLEKVKAIQDQRPGRRGKDFESDAQIADRIKRTQQEISTLLPLAPEYNVDTSDFQEVKVRLGEMKSGHKPDAIGQKNSEFVP